MAQLVDTSRSAQPQQPSYSSEARLRKEAETGWYKGEDKRPASRARTARPPPGAGEGAAGLASSAPPPEAGGAARRHLQEAPASADAGAEATEALVRRLVAEELGGLRQQVRVLEEEVQALRRQLQPPPPPPR